MTRWYVVIGQHSEVDVSVGEGPFRERNGTQVTRAIQRLEAQFRRRSQRKERLPLPPG